MRQVVCLRPGTRLLEGRWGANRTHSLFVPETCATSLTRSGGTSETGSVVRKFKNLTPKPNATTTTSSSSTLRFSTDYSTSQRRFYMIRQMTRLWSTGIRARPVGVQKLTSKFKTRALEELRSNLVSNRSTANSPTPQSIELHHFRSRRGSHFLK